MKFSILFFIPLTTQLPGAPPTKNTPLLAFFEIRMLLCLRGDVRSVAGLFALVSENERLILLFFLCAWFDFGYLEYANAHITCLTDCEKSLAYEINSSKINSLR